MKKETSVPQTRPLVFRVKAAVPQLGNNQSVSWNLVSTLTWWTMTRRTMTKLPPALHHQPGEEVLDTASVRVRRSQVNFFSWLSTMCFVIFFKFFKFFIFWKHFLCHPLFFEIFLWITAAWVRWVKGKRTVCPHGLVTVTLFDRCVVTNIYRVHSDVIRHAVL